MNMLNTIELTTVLYEASADMDQNDYADTKERAISELADELENSSVTLLYAIANAIGFEYQKQPTLTRTGTDETEQTKGREVDFMKQVQLQGIGKRNAIEVKNLKIGDVIMWNFGYTSKVIDLIPSKTGKTITAMLSSCNDGTVRPRKMGANRLVAVE